MAGLPAIADFAPPSSDCPTCGVRCKRHSVYVRKIKDIGLDGPVVLEIPVGNYRCVECRKFFKPELPVAGKGKRYTARAVRKATVAVQQDKTTYTALPHRLDRDFSIRPSKSTGWAWFQGFAAEIDIDEYLRWACDRFSGQISVDSVEDGGMQMWFATDPLNQDLILGYHRAEHADAASLTEFLTNLRDKHGITPQLFTGDDAAVFDKVPGQVWKDIPVPLCHFHIMKNLNYNYLRKSLRDRIKACQPKKPKKPAGMLSEKEATKLWERKKRYKAENERWTDVFRKRRLFLKGLRSLAKPESIERQEAEFIESAGRQYKALATFRAFILDFYAILGSKDHAAAQLLRQAFLARWSDEAKQDKYIGHVVQRFTDNRWFGKVFPFLAFENANRTTNGTISRRNILSGQLFPKFVRSQFEELAEAHLG